MESDLITKDHPVVEMAEVEYRANRWQSPLRISMSSLFCVLMITLSYLYSINLSRELKEEIRLFRQLTEAVEDAQAVKIDLLAIQMNQTFERVIDKQKCLMNLLKRNMYASYFDETNEASDALGAEVVFEEASIIQMDKNASQLLRNEINQPGECWAFKGQGKVIIKLAHPIIVTSVTYEHITKDMLPGGEGSLSSAPHKFSVLALSGMYSEPEHLGTFFYDFKKGAKQRFVLTNETLLSMPYIVYEIFDNWGNRKYTCAYRFRVHGVTA